MEFNAIIHTGSRCGNTIIDPHGVALPDEVPVIRGFHDREVIGKATGFSITPEGIHATLSVDDGIGLAPAISGRIVETRDVAGVRIVDRFDLQSVGLVPAAQTDTKPLTLS